MKIWLIWYADIGGPNLMHAYTSRELAERDVAGIPEKHRPYYSISSIELWDTLWGLPEKSNA